MCNIEKTNDLHQGDQVSVEDKEYTSQILKSLEILWPYLVTIIPAIIIVIVWIMGQRIHGLKEEVARLKDRIKAELPSAVVPIMHETIQILDGKLEVLNEDNLKNREEIKKIEDEKKELEEILEDTGALCPHCKAPMTYSEPRLYQQGPHEYDTMYYEYECGYAHEDGNEQSPCKN